MDPRLRIPRKLGKNIPFLRGRLFVMGLGIYHFSFTGQGGEQSTKIIVSLAEELVIGILFIHE